MVPSLQMYVTDLKTAIMFAFAAISIPPYRLATKHLIEVHSIYASSRYPDLIVHSEGIVDPSRQVVLVLRLQGDTYQQQRFQGNDCIRSPGFPAFDLTAEQVLQAGI